MIFELDIVTFLLRWFVALIILLCGLQVIAISHILKNKRLIKLTRKTGIVLIIFFMSRILAAIFDWWLAFSIGIASNIVNYAFWTWLYYTLLSNYQFLNSEKVGSDGRSRISDAIDELGNLIDEMKDFREKFSTDS